MPPGGPPVPSPSGPTSWLPAVALAVLPLAWVIAGGDRVLGRPDLDLVGHVWTLWNAGEGDPTLQAGRFQLSHDGHVGQRQQRFGNAAEESREGYGDDPAVGDGAQGLGRQRLLLRHGPSERLSTRKDQHRSAGE